MKQDFNVAPYPWKIDAFPAPDVVAMLEHGTCPNGPD